MSSKYYSFLKKEKLKRYLPLVSILILFYFIFYLLYLNVKNNTITKFNDEQIILAETASKGISSLLDNYQSVMSFVVKQKEIIEFPKGGNKMMKDFFETHKNVVKAITRIDSTGVIMHTYPLNDSVIGKNISNQEHVKQVVSTKKPVVSDVFMSVQGYYAIALHTPIFDKKKYVGSIGLLIPIDELGHLFLDEIKQSKKGHTWLITEKFTEIYCQNEGHEGKSILELSNNDDETKKLLQKIKVSESGTGKSKHNNANSSSNISEEMFVAFHRVPHGNTYWTTLISYQEKEVHLALTNFRNRLILISLLLLLAVFYYFYSFAKVQNILKEENKRKKAEILLRESNERFTSFMENTPIHAYIKDKNLTLIYQNKNLQSLISQKSEHNSTSSGYNFDKETTKMLERADKKIAVGKKDNIELVYSIKLNDKIIWFKEYKFRINISNTTFAIAGAAFDITEIKNYEKELELHKNHLEKLVKKRTKELESTFSELKAQKKEVESTLQTLKETQNRLVQSEKMASLGVLIAGVSHEINNPLHYLSGVNIGLENYFNEYGSQDKETTDLLLTSIKSSIERITSIVNGLNHFSRDNDNFDEDCDIHSIIDNCLHVLNNKYKYTIDIEKKYSKEKLVLKGNVGKLHQVFTNILTNAIQSFKNEGEITITTFTKDKNAIIEIKDTGKGISKENLNKIVDPFFTTKEPGEGTGLGLSITYSIIKDHKGKIEFESEINKGTKSIITLPLNKYKD